MSQELVAIISVGIALFGQSIFAMRSITHRIDRLSGRIQRMEDDVQGLGQAVAHTDGLLDGLRDAVSGRSAV